MAQQHLLGQGVLIVVDSRSLSYTPHWVGLFWGSDHPEQGNSTWQQIDFNALGGFEPAISAGMWPFTQALVCEATVISYYNNYLYVY